MKHTTYNIKHETRNTKHEAQNMFHDSSFMVRKHGQAAMTAVLILLFVSLAAEAGVEDGVYRLLRNKNLSPAYSVTLNGATADTIVTNISSAKKEIKTV